MPDQWAPQADLPDILVSPASPRDPLQPAGTAAERERDVAARGDTSSHSGRGGAESSTKGWQSGKAPPSHKRASHTSSIGGGGGNAGQKSDRSFLGSIAAALPTFSLSSFKLPGAPTFVTVERDDDEPRPSEDEPDFLARDEEDEDRESVEVSSDERDDQDGDDDGELVLTRADGPAPILARGGDGMTGTSNSADQVDLTNSPDLRIEDCSYPPSPVRALHLS